MKTYEELKNFCDKEIVKYPKLKTKYVKEIIVAKRYYENGRNLYEELVSDSTKISKRYIIPFLLGLTNEIKELPAEMIQVKSGASGGKFMPLYIGIYK